MSTELFFIYSTLKRGFKNRHHLENCEAVFVKEASAGRVAMFDLGHGFPYIQKTGSIYDSVKGELWSIHKSKIPYLDNLEGVPDLYKRITYKGVNMYVKAEPLDRGELGQQQLLSSWEED